MKESTYCQATMPVFRLGQKLDYRRQPNNFFKAGQHLMLRKIKRMKYFANFTFPLRSDDGFLTKTLLVSLPSCAAAVFSNGMRCQSGKTTGGKNQPRGQATQSCGMRRSITKTTKPRGWVVAGSQSTVVQGVLQGSENKRNRSAH